MTEHDMNRAADDAVVDGAAMYTVDRLHSTIYDAHL